MQVNSYCTFDPLKSCLVGRTYQRAHFQHIDNKKVKDTLFRILDETEEDYLNLCHLLETAGVEVHRPDTSANDPSVRPANQPRDDMIVMGDTLYVNNNRPEYESLFAKIDNKIFVDDCEQSKLVSSSFIHRLGQEAHWGTHRPEWRHSELVRKYKSEWESKGFNINVMDHEGHGDCTWCIPKPGIIVSLFGIQNYAEKFPGWDVCYIENKYWDQMSPFRKVKQKNGGKWWVPGEEDNDEFSTYVDTYLRDWVGYVEETVFEVNMLSLSQDAILCNNYNKQVFDFLEKHHVAPIICPFRHRWFWDGGVHCVTQDLYREGSLSARY